MYFDILALTLLSKQTPKLLTWASPSGTYVWQPGFYLPSFPLLHSQGRNLKSTPELIFTWQHLSSLLIFEEDQCNLAPQVLKYILDQTSLGL